MHGLPCEARTLRKRGTGLLHVTPSHPSFFLPSDASFRQIWFPRADMSPEHSGTIPSSACLDEATPALSKREPCVLSRACLRSQAPLGWRCPARTPRPVALAGPPGRVRTPGALPLVHTDTAPPPGFVERRLPSAPGRSQHSGRPRESPQHGSGPDAWPVAGACVSAVGCPRAPSGRPQGPRAVATLVPSRHRVKGRPRRRGREVKLLRSPQATRPWRGSRWVFPEEGVTAAGLGGRPP